MSFSKKIFFLTSGMFLLHVLTSVAVAKPTKNNIPSDDWLQNIPHDGPSHRPIAITGATYINSPGSYEAVADIPTTVTIASDNVSINMANFQFYADGCPSAIYVQNVSNFVLSNGQITGGLVNGIDLTSGAFGVTISDVQFNDNNGPAIAANDISEISISDCSFYDSFNAISLFESINCSILSCNFFENTVTLLENLITLSLCNNILMDSCNLSQNYCDASETLALIESCTNIFISNSTFAGNSVTLTGTQDSLLLISNSFAAELTNNIFNDNSATSIVNLINSPAMIITNCHFINNDGNAIYTSANDDVLVQTSIANYNGTGFILQGNRCTVDGCTLNFNGSYGCSIEGFNNYLKNNTAIGNTDSGFTLVASSTHCYVSNNVAINNNIGFDDEGTSNIFTGNYADDNVTTNYQNVPSAGIITLDRSSYYFDYTPNPWSNLSVE